MSLWKASSVFPGRCHYKVSLYCRTVHRHARPGLWVKLTARDLACNFFPAFFLMLKEHIFLASWLTWICSSDGFLGSKSLSVLEEISIQKGCLVSDTTYKILINTLQIFYWKLSLFTVLPTTLLLFFTSLVPHCPCLSWNLEYYQLCQRSTK